MRINLSGKGLKALLSKLLPSDGSEGATISLIAFDLHFNSLHKRAREGDTQAMFELAEHYLKDAPPQDIPRALSFLDRAATGGHVMAMMSLAKLYARGEHRSADPTKALHYYTLASNAGDADAMYALGAALELGRFGITQDYVTARRLFMKAAKAGNGAAAYRLGVFYINGYGVRPSLSNAALWFAVATRLKHAAARQAWVRLSQRLDEGQRAHVRENLIRWDQLCA
jgi:TPR repeat protein